MELPSKELLSAIHNVELTSEPIELTNISTLSYLAADGMAYMISIYELMHLMKEWAHNNGYQLCSGITRFFNVVKNERESYWFCSVKIKVYSQNLEIACLRLALDERKTYTLDSTEFEAVTKACEWVLNQKENNAKA